MRALARHRRLHRRVAEHPLGSRRQVLAAADLHVRMVCCSVGRRSRPATSTTCPTECSRRNRCSVTRWLPALQSVIVVESPLDAARFFNHGYESVAIIRLVISPMSRSMRSLGPRWSASRRRSSPSTTTCQDVGLRTASTRRFVEAGCRQVLQLPRCQRGPGSRRPLAAADCTAACGWRQR